MAARSGTAWSAGRRASWYPETAIPATLARLDAVGALVPDDWQSLYAQFGRTARAVQAERSASCPGEWCTGTPGRATRCRPARTAVTLIDWETSGLGLPVLDLGTLPDRKPPRRAAARRRARGLAGRAGRGPVGAVAEGYASAARGLVTAERALLPEAVRFGACYVGAIHLYRALAEGVSGTSMDARLERLRNRVEVSEAVARLAAPHLTGGAETVR